jgi:DNA replication protein DnaC
MGSSIYKEIMTDYERQLAADKRAQESRVQEVYTRIPRYKELDHRTADLSAEAAIKAASGLREDVMLIMHELSRISDEKKKILADAGLPKDYISLKYECPDCKDTGYVGGTKCHCLIQRLSQKLIENNYLGSGIYDKLQTENFDTFSFDYFSGKDLENMETIHSAALGFVDSFADSYRNMLFYGGVGCGKSFVSNCIAKALIDKGVAVVYVSAIRMFDILTDQHFSRGEKDRAGYDTLFSCPLLIIDDLGTEIISSAIISELFNILNERDLGSHPTIISTNLTLDEIKNKYNDRALSRIIGNYELYKFTGEDIRLKRRREA